MQSIIVDTSVAIKWLFEEDEDGFHQAQDILKLASQNQLRIIAPEIILLELANTVYLSKKQNFTDFKKSLKYFRSIFADLTTLKDITRIGYIMYKHNLTSYDAVFVALAEVRKVPLITADYRHHKKSISPHIIWLSGWKGKL